MKQRYFTVEEANQMIPFLIDAFTRIVQMRMQIDDIFELLEEADAAPTRDNFDIALPGASAAVLHNRATLFALLQAVRDDLDRIEATGCTVTNIDQGLVDWYAHRGNQDVLLCWRLGERDVRWWHTIHDGLAGRRPIEEFHERDDPSQAVALKTS